MQDVVALLEKLDGYREEMIETMAALTAIPALGPESDGDGEMAKARWVQSWLEALGIEVEREDAPDTRVPDGLRPNLIARLPGGDGPARWVLSHLDVVPVGELSQWEGDPWVMRREGDRLYGRGTLDDHAGLVSSMYALKAVKELGITPPGPCGLLIVSDEETGSRYGLDHVMSVMPNLVEPRDLLVVPDAGNEEGTLIEVAEKSILWLKVEVTGKQVHGSTPQTGVNALYTAARMMVASRGMTRVFDQTDELFHPPGCTFEPTRKEAGVPNINTIPGRDVFYLDCRVLPGIDLAEVEAAFAESFGAVAAEEGAKVSIEAVQRLQAPPATPADAPVVGALAGAIELVYGIKAAPGGVGGGTVAAFFRSRDLPCAVWCHWPDVAHIPNEWCSLSNLVGDAKVFAALFAGAGTSAS